MTKKKKMIISAIAIVLLWVTVGLTVAFLIEPNMYTTEQHIKRISKRIEKKYVQTGEVTDFKVYPLYNAEDGLKFQGDYKVLFKNLKLRYFLVEFEPEWFLIIRVGKGGVMYMGGMYMLDTWFIDRTWSRYRISESRPAESDGIYWGMKEEYKGISRWYEYDHGVVKHSGSPYKAAGIAPEEKKYFLPIGGEKNQWFIPAVKRGDKFLNLMSLEEFVYDSNAISEVTPSWQVTYFYMATL